VDGGVCSQADRLRLGCKPERFFSVATPAADLGGACRVFNSFLLNRASPPGGIPRQLKAWITDHVELIFAAGPGHLAWNRSRGSRVNRARTSLSENRMVQNGMLEQARGTEGRRDAPDFRVSRESSEPFRRLFQPDKSRCPTGQPVRSSRTGRTPLT